MEDLQSVANYSSFCSSSSLLGWEYHNLGVHNADMSHSSNYSLSFSFIFCLLLISGDWIICIHILMCNHAFLCMFAAVPDSNYTPPYLSCLDNSDYSTGYLQDALLEFSSKRRRLVLLSDDQSNYSACPIQVLHYSIILFIKQVASIILRWRKYRFTLSIYSLKATTYETI